MPIPKRNSYGDFWNTGRIVYMDLNAIEHLIPDDAIDNLLNAGQYDEIKLVHECYPILTKRQRESISLILDENMSQREAADELKISRCTLRCHIRNAVKKIQKELGVKDEK